MFGAPEERRYDSQAWCGEETDDFIRVGNLSSAIDLLRAIAGPSTAVRPRRTSSHGKDNPSMSRNWSMQMASDMGARGRVEMQDATFIAIGRNLLQTCRTTAPSPGLRSSTAFLTPGATYSAKFFTAVTFSLK